MSNHIPEPLQDQQLQVLVGFLKHDERLDCDIVRRARASLEFWRRACVDVLLGYWVIDSKLTSCYTFVTVRSFKFESRCVEAVHMSQSVYNRLLARLDTSHHYRYSESSIENEKEKDKKTILVTKSTTVTV